MNDAYQMGMENNRKAVYGAQLGANFEDRAAIDRGHCGQAGIQGWTRRANRQISGAVSVGCWQHDGHVRCPQQRGYQDISAGANGGRGLRYAGSSVWTGASADGPRAHSSANGPSVPKSSDAPKVSDDTFNMGKCGTTADAHLSQHARHGHERNVVMDPSAQASLLPLCRTVNDSKCKTRMRT